jgi:hypothetical protein
MKIKPGRLLEEQMRGGEAIAYGSDGCIFTPRLVIKTGADGVRTAVPSDVVGFGMNEDDDNFVSKVFFSRQVANNEYTVLREVNDTTGGTGTVKYYGAIEEFDILGDNVPDVAGVGYKDLGRGRRAPTICARLKASPASEPKYMIHMERISGDLLRLIVGPTLHPSAFLQAWQALKMLHDRPRGGIFHLDLAQRNIFMKGDKAILGDYGSGYMVNGPESFDDFVRRYVDRYSIGIGSLIDNDGISPEFALALTCYNAILDPAVGFRRIADSYMQVIHGEGGGYGLTDLSIVPAITDEGQNARYWQKLDDLLLTIARLSDAGDREALKTLIISLAAASDKKIFLQSILPKIELPLEEKNRLYEAVLLNDNFAEIDTMLRTERQPQQQDPTAAARVAELQRRLDALMGRSPAQGGGSKRRSSRRRRTVRRSALRRRLTARW